MHVSDYKARLFSWKHHFNMATARGVLSVFRNQCQILKKLTFANYRNVPLLESSGALFHRNYKGSNRYKRMKVIKDQRKLEKELETKYGISNRPNFDVKAWMKENYFKEIAAFQKRLGIVFNDQKVLISALTHSSFVDELNLCSADSAAAEEDENLCNRFKILHQLSDIQGTKLSLIGYNSTLSVLKNGLYRRYSNMTAGICEGVVNFLTHRETIVALAKSLAIDELILFSTEIEKNDINEEAFLNFTTEDVISDAFFGVVGAIEIDLGKDVMEDFVKDFVLTLIDFEDLADHVNLEDPHSELMKILSMHGINGVTRARIIGEAGVDTSFPFFHVGMYCNSFKIAEGCGHSVFSARMDAIKNSVFSCLEDNVDFQMLRKSKKLL